jgi:exosortase
VRSPSRLEARTACLALAVLATVVAFWGPLSALRRVALREEHYSHILLIPLVTLGLLILERRTIFAQVDTHRVAAGALLSAAALVLGARHWATTLSENDRLSAAMFALVLVWLAAYVACYGLPAARRALFPLLFLFLVVPFPDAVLNWSIVALQKGSTELTAVVFDLIGVPAFRDGFTFMLPGVTIEVARECSGIRSSMAMLITSLVAGHLVLRTGWARAVLSVATIPLLLVKNAIRIVTLTLLTIYVDPRFLTGSLHTQGGVVFFGLALLLLFPVLRLLQRSERQAGALRPSAVSRS